MEARAFTPPPFFETTPPTAASKGRVVLTLSDNSQIIIGHALANQFPPFEDIIADVGQADITLIFPSTVALIMCDFPSPQANKIILRAAIIEPTPIVMALCGTSATP